MRNAVSATLSISAMFSFPLLRGYGILELKRSGLRSSPTSQNFLVDNCYDLSDLRMAVKVRSSQFAARFT